MKCFLTFFQQRCWSTFWVFLYSALAFRHYKTSEFKGNAVDFAKGGKNLQDLFGFADPEFGEWRKRINFDKWIQMKNSNRWLDKHENDIDNQCSQKCCLKIPKGWNVALCRLSEEKYIVYYKKSYLICDEITNFRNIM